MVRPQGLPVEERFWGKVQRCDAEECWPWLEGTTSDGYGRFGITSEEVVGAHRFAYELIVGPIPAGLTIDHLCRNILCCNPAHMETVTNSENVRRLWEYRRGSQES